MGSRFYPENLSSSACCSLNNAPICLYFQVSICRNSPFPFRLRSKPLEPAAEISSGPSKNGVSTQVFALHLKKCDGFNIVKKPHDTYAPWQTVSPLPRQAISAFSPEQNSQSRPSYHKPVERQGGAAGLTPFSYHYYTSYNFSLLQNTSITTTKHPSDTPIPQNLPSLKSPTHR